MFGVSLLSRQLCCKPAMAALANSRALRLCVHPFDPLSAECGSYKWIGKVLCFPRDLVALELHDAHGVGRLAVVRQDEFGDPKLTAANDSSDRKPLFVRLAGALVLDVGSTASSLARLRVLKHRIFEIDAVLRFKIVGIGRRPMLIQRRADRLIPHSRTLLVVSPLVHLGPFHQAGSEMLPRNRNVRLVKSRCFFGHCYFADHRLR